MSDTCTNQRLNVGVSTRVHGPETCGPRLSGKVEQVHAPASSRFFQGCVQDLSHQTELDTQLGIGRDVGEGDKCCDSVALPVLEVVAQELSSDKPDFDCSHMVCGPDVLVVQCDSELDDINFQHGECVVELGESASMSECVVDLDFISDFRVLTDDCTLPLYVSSRCDRDSGTVEIDGYRFAPPCGKVCTGVHFVGGRRIQLNPCVFFHECFDWDQGMDVNSAFIMDGLLHGFRILDDDFVGGYFCSNYNSILDGTFKVQMDQTILAELDAEKITMVDSQPRCVHSLGAVSKSDGSLRPITDCKRPLGESINNHMNTVCDGFKFIRIDEVAEVMTPGCYFSVVDIQSAYRSVNIFPDHRTCQGFRWNVDGQDRWFEDNCLSFGLKCAAFIFSRVSEFVVRAMNRRGHSRVFSY